jgi:ribosomal protein RSM22 (predicted rRNA methylase)
MPATYAAVAASLIELGRLRPDFAPASLLDAGAGPGTASWAAVDMFSSLTEIAQLDANPALRALARDLVHDAARFDRLQQSAGDLRTALGDAPDADLVIASYVLGEITDADRIAVAELLWRKTRDTLLLVEPGTPAGYARLIEIRTRLIAAGAQVVAPCPHALACPLIAPNWCHFTQRLARSRDHKQVKGAELPFEDEKYSYLALSRTPAPRPAARVLAQPVTTKIEVTAKLCRADGIAAISKTPRRDKAHYADARRWRWGDVVEAAVD